MGWDVIIANGDSNAPPVPKINLDYCEQVAGWLRLGGGGNYLVLNRFDDIGVDMGCILSRTDWK